MRATSAPLAQKYPFIRANPKRSATTKKYRRAARAAAQHSACDIVQALKQLADTKVNLTTKPAHAKQIIAAIKTLAADKQTLVFASHGGLEALVKYGQGKATAALISKLSTDQQATILPNDDAPASLRVNRQFMAHLRM